MFDASWSRGKRLGWGCVGEATASSREGCGSQRRCLTSEVACSLRSLLALLGCGLLPVSCCCSASQVLAMFSIIVVRKLGTPPLGQTRLEQRAQEACSLSSENAEDCRLRL